jgi:glycosyltransferase involved in cell wall biosynthesis
MSAPVKVAFDSSALSARYRHHGIQVYARNLLESLRTAAPRYGMEIRPFISTEQRCDDGTFAETPGFRPRTTPLLKFDRLWRYGGAAAAAYHDGADILLNPNGASLPVSFLLPIVTTIHDLTPMVLPCYPRRIAMLLRFLLTRSAKTSAAIITVSEHSRQDIVRICGVQGSKVHVVYEGHDRRLFHDTRPAPAEHQALLARLGIGRPYILHHGAIQPRKNLARLIAAYRLIRSRSKLDFDLVLAGPLAWQFDEIVTAARNPGDGGGNVVLTGSLSDHDLSLLLRGATLEVVPSLYEGFCLPLVEAMACGVPTIAANCSSLPEVSGGVLRYFDPGSVEEMAACIQTVLESANLCSELAERGRAHAQRFSWQQCAEETLAVLEQVARAGRIRTRAAGVAL